MSVGLKMLAITCCVFGGYGQVVLGADSPSAWRPTPRVGWIFCLGPISRAGIAWPCRPPANWAANSGTWSPTRRLLVCDGDGGHDMLLFEKEFGDAVFHCEFRYVPVEGKTGYNSGVYIRNSRDGAIWHQAQIGDATGGYLFGETPTAGGKPKFFTLANEVKDMRVKPAGQWNTLEMTARGKTLTLWVNGAVTCQFRDCGLEKGRVGVEGEGYRIEFRNLKVKELR